MDRRSIENETPDERRRRYQENQNARRKKLRAEESPEERQVRLTRRNESDRKKRLEEASEQRRERLDEMNERLKEGRLEESEEERQTRLEKRKRRKGQSPEAREKLRFSRLLKRLAMTEEEREEVKRKKYFYYEANRWKFLRGNWTEEERERKREAQRNYLRSLTGEKKQRYRESVARAIKKCQKKQLEALRRDPVRWEEHKRRVNECQRKRYANETPEQRLRRRRKDAIGQSKRRLRKELEEQNASPEKVEIQLRDLGERLWGEYYPGEDYPSGRRRPRKQLVGREGPPTPKEKSVEERTSKINRDDFHEDFTMSPPSSTTSDLLVDREEQPVTASMDFSEFAKAAEQEEATPDSKNRKTYWKCPKCDTKVLSPTDLSQHYLSVHKSDPPSQDDLQEESAPVAGHDQGERWRFCCMKCPPELLQKFVNRDELFCHVKEEHPSSFWPCQLCHLLKYSESALIVHQKIYHQA